MIACKAGLDLVVPPRPIPASWCHTEGGRPLDPEEIALDLPAGGNITLRLAEPPAAGVGVRLQLSPHTPAAGR